MQSKPDSPRRRAESIGACLARARHSLGDRLEADLLACHALACERSWLYAHDRDPINPRARGELERLVEQRLEGRPIAQLCGEREFYGRAFLIDERVLIPRPETELIVDLALSLRPPDRARVCDVGTGSGCIALKLAAERPRWRVTGVDRSAEALAVASANRERLGLGRLELVPGDLLEALAGRRFDLIVSNPPYVADDDPHLARGDLRFEPRTALAAGPDGLDVIRRLIPAAFEAIADGGHLLIEHGHDQANQVRALFRQAGFKGVGSRRDLAGIERVTLGARAA